MGKSTRSVELATLKDIAERQLLAWIKQITAVPGVGNRLERKR